jgi:renalase
MTKKIAIIGAGISGTNLASKLKDDFEITLFEKARGPGGRTATRRFQDGDKVYRIDHGAQYIDVESQEFQDFINDLEKKGIIEKFTKLATEKTYVPIPAMNAVAKYLVDGINSQYATRPFRVERAGEQNILFDEEENQLGCFDLIISTAPPKQTADLFKGFSEFEFLSNIEMKAHFAIMLISSKVYDFGFTEMHIQDKDSILNWIGINSEKPKRGDELAIIMHTNFKWTLEHKDKNWDAIIELALAELLAKTGFQDNKPLVKACHRWLYGRALEPLAKDFIFDKENNLACCGDYMLGDNIEAAYLSSTRLARELKNNYR